MSTKVFGMAIRAIAAYAPPGQISNDWIAVRLREERELLQDALGRELSPEEAKEFETSDRWIRRYIGFTSRRFVAPGEGTADLASRAVQLLLQRNTFKPHEVDYVMVATVTPSYLYSPPDAALVQHAAGITESLESPADIGGATVSLACSSWVAALRQSYALIRAGMARRILLIGADAMSRTINWRDRAFATVLGDAGTAMELVAVPARDDWFTPNAFWSWLGGSQADVIMTPAGGSRNTLTPEDVATSQHCLHMDGRMVRELMVPFVGGPGLHAALAKAQLRITDLNLAVLHEANLVLNAEITKRWKDLGFRGTTLDAGGMFGNTTSASIPLALAMNPAALQIGSRFGLFGFGGGLSAAFAFGKIKSTVAIATDL